MLHRQQLEGDLLSMPPRAYLTGAVSPHTAHLQKLSDFTQF
jgi:hypothetical protein